MDPKTNPFDMNQLTPVRIIASNYSNFITHYWSGMCDIADDRGSQHRVHKTGEMVEIRYYPLYYAFREVNYIGPLNPSELGKLEELAQMMNKKQSLMRQREQITLQIETLDQLVSQYNTANTSGSQFRNL
jgi:hypothetical protein